MRKLALALFAAACAVSINAAAHAQSAADNPKLKAIIDAARQEGQLSIVTGEGTLGNPMTPLIEGFNKYYGLTLDVRFTPGPPMPNVVAQVVQQYQAHHAAVTDVIIGYANHMMDLIAGGGGEKVDWKSWAPNLQRPELVSPEGVAVPVMSSTVGIAYNTTVFQGSDVPTKFADFLNPKLKGHVATTPYASSFDRLATTDLWGADKTLDFAKNLSAQVGGLIRCNEMDRIASGEFDAFGLTCSQNDALAAVAKGAPVGFALASDAPIVMPLYEAVPATAAHPNAAKLWINYMSSPGAQKLLYQVGFADLDSIPGSQTARSIKTLQDKGVKFLVVDTDFYRNHDQAALNKVLGEVQKIFRER
ncbi:MAG TPA: ABC transporter substrate-binding protein [Stellaceae bacterium]|jgi:iron(III) transport system substrate-binding protein|nr:ABC transporter substrate-binding protein [Stellaceae bacterium]